MKRSYAYACDNHLIPSHSSHPVPSALAENWLIYWISRIGLPPTENPSSFYCERSGLKWTEVDSALKKCCIFAPNFNLHNSDIWSSHLPFMSDTCPTHLPYMSHLRRPSRCSLATLSLLTRYLHQSLPTYYF